MTERAIGRLEGKLEAIIADIDDGKESRRRLHEKLETVGTDIADVKRDVRDLDARMKAMEPTVADISKWRERGIGAIMLISFAAASVGGLVVAFGKRIWAALSG